MPKISAATVVEHRAAQRRALLDAARDLLAEAPDRVPSLADVAVRAGLARSSVYHYFGSRDDLLRAVVEDMFPRWNARIVAAMNTVDDPAERVLAYIEVNLRLVAEGEHAVIGVLATFTPQAFTNERMHALHQELVLPLLDALREQGRPDPELTAEFINALVYKGTELIESGRSLDEVLDTIRNLAALGSERTSF
ncbi:TetR/AcrR family transcriptional regulator [Rhodococcus sp. HM1]|uniref:TetR/AcrR family transcriptional regulator n=1 Tax=unclassified Rhodococcus (in: high G+C Gram-positive bacteria) TaxID=192944 RepID=UPI0018CF7F6B|nr:MULTISPECIES: TetR/AcrR family transcriptional regulator [unclassified Rhodococcus (in: high G+C Gram-positive bacteria)]MBH0123314.1 TetR/AcrR family transcriptional regulator [Rhodococcus sp. CX]MCK8672172.1 TetR/AcrR family transcriptional regulator [Rhodococcus sp. HM1]